MNLTVGTANVMATALNTRAGPNAKLVIYTGTQPTTADAALANNAVLATVTMSSSAFGTVNGNVITAQGLPTQANATGSGIATWARLYESDGVTGIGDFTVGTSGTEIVINTTGIAQGGPVQIVSYLITITQ